MFVTIFKVKIMLKYVKRKKNGCDKCFCAYFKKEKQTKRKKQAETQGHVRA